jgi:hypothetical protein
MTIKTKAIIQFVHSTREVALLAKCLIEKVNVTDVEALKLLDYIEHRSTSIIGRVGKTVGEESMAISFAIRGGTIGRQSLIGDLSTMVSLIFGHARDLNNQYLNFLGEEGANVRKQAGDLFEIIADCVRLKEEAIKESEDFFV